MTRDIEARLKEEMAEELWRHSLSTAETAREMAETFKAGGDKAYLVGLLHDCAKLLSDEETLEQARAFGLIIDEIDEREPYLLHAAVGSRLAREVYGVEDDEVLAAIERHTLGDAGMKSLDKIAYVADMIEPGRGFPGLEEIRRLAREDLDACYASAYAHTLEYLARARRPIHPRTLRAWNSIVLGG